MTSQVRSAIWGLGAALLYACGKDGTAPHDPPGFVAVATRASLAATDNLDWSVLGPPNGTHIRPVTIRSDNGTSVVVTNSVIPPGPSPPAFLRARQNFFGGWRGNFAFGDELIYTGGAQVITIDFPTPIVAAGTQVQPGSLVVAFTVRVEALSSSDEVLAFFDVQGVSTNAEDNSAPFVAIRGTNGASFDKIRITNRTVMSQPGIAINRFDFTPASSGAR